MAFPMPVAPHLPRHPLVFPGQFVWHWLWNQQGCQTIGKFGITAAVLCNDILCEMNKFTDP
jgi:hypothetical protein